MYVIYLIFGELSNLGHGHGTYVNDGKTESASFGIITPFLLLSHFFQLMGNVYEQKMKVKSLSRIRPFVAYPAPPSVGFSKQEYWSGLPFPSPGNLPDPGIEPAAPETPALQADSLPIEPPGKPSNAIYVTVNTT